MDVLTSADAQRCGALLERDQFFWLDLVDPSADELHDVARDLGLHPLALEDTREFGQPPKLDHFGDHVLLVFYSAREAPAEALATVESLEVHLYIAGGFVLTVRRAPAPELDALRLRLGAAPAMTEEDLVYAILDALADALLHTIVALERRIDALEADVLRRVRPEHVAAIYRLKQDVRDLLRRAAQQREHFDDDADAILALPGFEAGHRRYLDDVRDHLMQAASELTRQSEDLQALTSTYFNANAQRLNRIAARLSVIATFFLVWTLVTSFFGQNFKWLTDNVDTQADFLTWGVGSLVASTLLVALVLWWRRHDLR